MQRGKLARRIGELYARFNWLIWPSWLGLSLYLFYDRSNRWFPDWRFWATGMPLFFLVKAAIATTSESSVTFAKGRSLGLRDAAEYLRQHGSICSGWGDKEPDHSMAQRWYGKDETCRQVANTLEARAEDVMAK
jgi:hypothetical protein